MEYHLYTNKLIDEFHLTNYVRVKDYNEAHNHNEVLSNIPAKSGVYFVIVPPIFHVEDFIYPGSGGYYKGKDPNVPIEKLKTKWIKEADVLYIGKAGGIERNGKSSNANLRVRIKALLEFGNGKNIGHWGGRYLWQFVNSQELLVYWYVCNDDENAVILEKNIILDFKRQYGRLPFANLRE